MLKTMKKVVCKLLALAIVMSVVTVPITTSVSASETEDVIWTQKYYQDFDGISELSEDDASYAGYYSHAALTPDSTGGSYLELAPSSDTDDPYGLKLSFPGSADVDMVKLEYAVKIADNTANSWWPVSEKITPTGTGRAWSLRAALVARIQIQETNYSDIAAVTNTSGWFTVTHEYDNSTKTITTSVVNPDGAVKSGTKTFTAGTGGLDYYWFGCQSGATIAYDNIKVSYGHNKPENFEETFTGMTELTAKDGIAYNVVENETYGKSVELAAEGDNTFIKVSPKAVTTAISDSSGSTEEWCVDLSAFDGSDIAKQTTLSYKFKFTDDSKFDSASTNKFDAYQAISNKVYTNGSNRNWAFRVCPVLMDFYPIYSNTATHIYPESYADTNTNTMDDFVIGDWYTAEFAYTRDNSGDSVVYKLVSTLYNANNEIVKRSEESQGTTGPITSYVFGVDKVGHTICLDDIKVTYSFEEELVTPEASIKIYAGEEEQTDLASASMLTDKVVVDFSTEMDEASINENSVYIENASGTKIACSAELDSANKKYTMTLTSLLAPGAYNVVVTEQAMSNKSVAAEPASVSFTVSAETPEIPSEDYSESYELDFDEMEIGAASDITGVITYNEGADAQIVSGGVEGNCLRLTPKTAVTTNADPIGAASRWSASFNNFDTSTNADKVRVEYMVKLSDITVVTSEAFGGYYAADKVYGVLKGTTRSWANRIGTVNSNLMEDKTNSATGTIGTAIDAPNDWVEITYEYDTKAGVLTGAYGQNGIVADSGKRSDTGMIKALLLGTEAGETIYIDNFKVTYLYNAPTVTSDSITLKNVKGDIQENWNTIDLLTKSVSIDFGTVMDATKLNNTYIYLSKDGGATKVAYVPVYEDGIYTMNLQETLLKETTYTLYISPEVANIAGETVGDEAVSFDFTTGTGERRAELIAVKINGEKVTSLSGLTASSAAQVVVDYSNTTGEAQEINVIIAYYAGDMLKSAELIKSEIDADVVTMTYIYDFNVLSDMSDVTAVKVMSWSAFGEMIPLSASIDL